MIITAGIHKGRKIKTLKSGSVRPTSSKIRESIFNIVQLCEEGTIFYEGDTIFLDLFAGSGIMGLEALSRGAKKAVFAEKNSEAIKILNQNLSLIKPDNSMEVFSGDALKALKTFKQEEFNFIFIDPPYKSDLYEPALVLIKTYNILAKEGIIVLEHDMELDIQELSVQTGYGIYKTRLYGNTGISFLTQNL